MEYKQKNPLPTTKEVILKTSKGKIQEKQILRPTTKENVVRALLQTLV